MCLLCHPKMQRRNKQSRLTFCSHSAMQNKKSIKILERLLMAIEETAAYLRIVVHKIWWLRNLRATWEPRQVLTLQTAFLNTKKEGFSRKTSLKPGLMSTLSTINNKMACLSSTLILNRILRLILISYKTLMPIIMRRKAYFRRSANWSTILVALTASTSSTWFLARQVGQIIIRSRVRLTSLWRCASLLPASKIVTSRLRNSKSYPPLHIIKIIMGGMQTSTAMH